MTEMKRYVGTKYMSARPMTRGEYNVYRGWPMPSNENPTDPGYFVEYEDGGKPNDIRHAGYISWSPKEVFERTYHEVKAPPLPTQAEIDSGPHAGLGNLPGDYAPQDVQNGD